MNHKYPCRNSIREAKNRDYALKQNEKRKNAFKGDKEILDFSEIGRSKTFE